MTIIVILGLTEDGQLIGKMGTAKKSRSVQLANKRSINPDKNFMKMNH
ncbi:MAG: hypothetical protein ACOCYO_02715 [Bacteroidota bacterium]